MTTIAIDARMIHSSGIGVVLDNLLQHIIAQRPSWKFLLIGDRRDLAHYKAENVRVITFTAPIYSLQEQWLGLLMSREKPDLVWTPHYNIPLLWRGRLLVTIHDLLPLAHPELFPSRIKQGYARFMFGQVSRRATRTAFISQFTADEFSRLVGPPIGQSSVIYNGVKADFFHKQRPRPRTAPYVLFVGNIKPHKNLGRLIEAFNQIVDRIPHELILVGKREGFITGDSALTTLVAGNSRVFFTGPVDDASLASYYAHADALAMPSYYEGFGLPPLEAMAAGCPVLAARAGSLPEICGNAALYCDPWQVSDIAGQLYLLLTDERLRTSLKREAQIRAGRFDWQRAAASYLVAIEEAF